jgi:bifunctional oligoribonuclease and PAP phosphatase NrnA
MQQQLNELKPLLAIPKKIVITTHHKPDADALGSSLALARFLKKLKHDVQVIVPSDYPSFLDWMSGNESVWVYSEGKEERSAAYIEAADIIFCLDFNALGRINELGSLVGKSKAIKVLVDHHLEPQNFAEISISDTSAAATCTLIYELIVGLDGRHLMDTYIAECIYAGIMTDTGSFRHSNTDQKVHRIIAELYEWNLDSSRVHRLIFDTNSEERLRLLGFCLSEKLVVLADSYTAFMYLSAEELQRFDAQTGDTEGLVNYALSLDKVVFAAMIIEREDGVKISFRSKGDFNVNVFARTHFEGGGHKNASGGRSLKSLPETVRNFREIVSTYKEELLENLRKEKFLC